MQALWDERLGVGGLTMHTLENLSMNNLTSHVVNREKVVHLQGAQNMGEFKGSSYDNQRVGYKKLLHEKVRGFA